VCRVWRQMTTTWHSQALTIRRWFQVWSKCPSKMSNTRCEWDGFATETKCSHQSIIISVLIKPDGIWSLCLGSSSGEMMIGIPSVQKFIRDEIKLPVALVHTGRPTILDPLRIKALWCVYWRRKYNNSLIQAFIRYWTTYVLQPLAHK